MKHLPKRNINDNITFSYYQTMQERHAKMGGGVEWREKEESLLNLRVIPLDKIFDEDTCDTDEEIIGLQF